MWQLCLQTSLQRPAASAPSVPSTSGRSLVFPAPRPHGLPGSRPPAPRTRRSSCAMHGYQPTENHPVFQAFLGVGVSSEDWHRASSLEPELLDYGSERLHAMLDFLLDLGLTGTDIGKVLVAFPQAFKLSLDHHASPVVDFLRSDMGMGPEQVADIITRFPSILGMSVKGQLRPQLAYLSSLGVAPEALPGLVLARPLVLGPGIEFVTSFLRRAGVPRQQMARLLRSYPLDYKVRIRGLSAPAAGSSSSSPSWWSGGPPPPPGGSGGSRGRGRNTGH